MNAWTGDVPLVADGHYTSEIVLAVRLAAGMPEAVRHLLPLT